MKQLYLLRHGKAEAGGADGTDWSRPLAEKGRLDAQALAGRLKQEALKPDIILASNAPRAESTARIVAKALGIEHLVLPVPELYEAEAIDYLEVIKQTISTLQPEQNIAGLMIVAHNPVIQEFAEKFILSYLKMKTCSLCLLEIDITTWSELSFDTPLINYGMM